MTPQSDKDVPASGAKSFDVVAPGKSAPPTSGKPIIITNRPMVKDPMAPGSTSRSMEFNQNQPPESTLLMPPDGSHRQVPTVVRVPGQTKLKTIAVPENHSAQDIREPANIRSSVVPNTSAEPPAPAAVAAKADSQEKDVERQPAGPLAELPPSGETTAPNMPLTDNDKRRAEKENEARLAEQEKIVASKKYFLPIEDAAKRRNNGRALMWLVVVLIATVIWLDVALDAGVVRISGVHALTHFFKW